MASVSTYAPDRLVFIAVYIFILFFYCKIFILFDMLH